MVLLVLQSGSCHLIFTVGSPSESSVALDHTTGGVITGSLAATIRSRIQITPENNNNVYRQQ
jgi:hypothetical protein